MRKQNDGLKGIYIALGLLAFVVSVVLIITHILVS